MAGILLGSFPDLVTNKMIVFVENLVREGLDLPERPFLGQKLPEIADDPDRAYI